MLAPSTLRILGSILFTGQEWNSKLQMRPSDSEHKKNALLLDNTLPLLGITAQNEYSRHTCIINTNSDDIIPLDAQTDATLKMLPTEEAFIAEQALDNFCKASPPQGGQKYTKFFPDARRPIVNNYIVDDTVQLLSQNHFITEYSQCHTSLL